MRVKAGSAPIGPPAMRSQFDAMMGTRRLRGWNPSSQNLNSLLANGGPALVARARDLCRNNGYARNACDAFASSVIGAGIKPSSLVTEPETKAEIQRAWLEWTDEADADGLTDFYGMQALAARALFEAGECFFRLRPRRLSDGLSAPLQLQMLEAEMCPWDLNRVEPNGNVIRSGIEFDLIGQRVRYWFHRRHPGDASDPRTLDSLYTSVPAEQVLHLFQPTRPGQIRGVPWLAPAMVMLRILGDYDDAELERKRIAALFAGFVTKAFVSGSDVLPTEADMTGGPPLSALEPGAMQVLEPGEDIKFSEPADVGGNYEAFQYRALTHIAAAIGLPYAALTGDLRQTSYGSIRAGLVEHRRRVDQLQHGTLVFQLCRPVWRAWMEAAVLSGRLSFATGYAVSPGAYRAAKWIPPAWAWVDPLKDRQAEAIAVANGWKARSDVIEAEGYDPEETDQRIASDHERAKRMQLNIASPATTSAAAATRADQQEQPA